MTCASSPCFRCLDGLLHLMSHSLHFRQKKLREQIIHVCVVGNFSCSWKYIVVQLFFSHVKMRIIRPKGIVNVICHFLAFVKVFQFLVGYVWKHNFENRLSFWIVIRTIADIANQVYKCFQQIMHNQ